MMGSPRTLNDVLTTTPQPGLALELRDQIVELRMMLLPHGLDARRIIDVCDRRNIAAQTPNHWQQIVILPQVGIQRQPPLFLHRRNQQHVWALAIQFEVVRHPLRQHRRRKRPERFAVLDPQIQAGLHIRIARIAEDRPRSQRARPKLQPARQMADDLALNQLLREETIALSFRKACDRDSRRSPDTLRSRRPRSPGPKYDPPCAETPGVKSRSRP